MNEKAKLLFSGAINGLILYEDFKKADLSQEDYLRYVRLCENLRCACIAYSVFVCSDNLYWHPELSLSIQNEYNHAHTPQKGKEKENELKSLNKMVSAFGEEILILIEELTGEKYPRVVSPIIYFTGLRSMMMFNNFKPHDRFWEYEHKEYGIYKYISLNDFRLWFVENFIAKTISGDTQIRKFIPREPKPQIPPDKFLREIRKRKFEEKCQYYKNTQCTLLNQVCDSDTCNSYQESLGLPINRILADEKTVDFGDIVTVLLQSTGELIGIEMFEYPNQINMPPLQKNLIHKKIGDEISYNDFLYTIVELKKGEKALPNKKTTSKKLPLTLREKAEIKLHKLEDELLSKEDNLHDLTLAYEEMVDNSPENPDTTKFADYIVALLEILNNIDELQDQVTELQYGEISDLEDQLDCDSE